MSTSNPKGAPSCRAAWLPRPGKLFLLLAGVLLPTAFGADGDPVDTVEKSAAEWVKTRVETSRIQSEWQSQRELLESTVDALADRAQTLETNQHYLEAKTSKDREELASLDEANKKALVGFQTAEERVKAMSDRLVRLRRSLPPRLSAALEMAYRSLGGANLPVSERMQLNMTIINRLTQFNRSITSEMEVVNVGGDGNGRLLEVLYWGLSHGYAFDASSGKAWLGFPGPQGWQWEPHPESAGSVAKLIAIYKEKADPEYVAVPAMVGHPNAENPAK